MATEKAKTTLKVALHGHVEMERLHYLRRMVMMPKIQNEGQDIY